MREILLTLALALGFAKPSPRIILAIEATAPDNDVARIMLVWGVYESSLKNDIPGDGGRSKCWLQIMDRGSLDELNCARTWVSLLNYDEKLCGSRRRALGAIATGHCGGAPKLVQHRLEKAGVLLP